MVYGKKIKPLEAKEPTQENPGEQKKKTGKKPAHDLRIDMVPGSLPVEVDPESTEQPHDGTQDHTEVGKAVVVTLYLPACLIKFPDPGRALGDAMQREEPRQQQRSSPAYPLCLSGRLHEEIWLVSKMASPSARPIIS